MQRSPDPPAGGNGVLFRGQMFTEDPVQLRTLLETLTGERGEAEADKVVYGFLRMSQEDKFALQLKGVDAGMIERTQSAFEPVVQKFHAERKSYLAAFRDEAIGGTLLVLERSRAELLKEREKYSEDGSPDGKAPDLDGLRAAAKALAAKRRAADLTATKAKDAFEKMRTQRQAPAHPGSFVPPPIVPYFPDAALRDAARETNEAWWQQEKEYGALRATHEAKFPALAMYADNEDGGAADRLDDLPTWGFFADARMKAKIFNECSERIRNNQSAADDMSDAEKVWMLPQMIQLTLRAKNAKPYEQRWVNAEMQRVQTEAAERARLIAAVALGVALVAGALTLGAALAPAGAAGAAVLATMATTAQVASTGLTIAVAYQELRDYQFKKESSATDLDKAESIAHDDPSFLWLAVTLVGVGLELAALKAAFASLKEAIHAARASRSVATLAEQAAKVPNVPPATAESIVGRVAAEIETLPPLPPQQAVTQALDRLSAWDTIPAAERGQVVLDALAGGDGAAILARTGKNARQLVDALGKTSSAARQLQAALTRRAYQQVGPALRNLGQDLVLDDAAVARIVSRNDVGQIKGQILEEAMEAETRGALAAGADDPARKALLRGAEGEGPAEYIAGSRITGTDGRQLSDGMVAVLRGNDEIVVIRAMESKAGTTAKGELSREAAKKFSELPEHERTALLQDGARILRRRKPELRSLSLDDIVKNHQGDVMDVVAKEFPQTSEWGQAVRTSERLGMDIDEAGHTIPAEIMVDGVRRKVRFPGAEGRPQVTGVLPSDIKPGRMPGKVAREQGVKLDIMNVKGVNQARLKALAEQVATAKGLPLQ